MSKTVAMSAAVAIAIGSGAAALAGPGGHGGGHGGGAAVWLAESAAVAEYAVSAPWAAILIKRACRCVSISAGDWNYPSALT
jgi:hypothetical protein